jgi:hypothetical protein
MENQARLESPALVKLREQAAQLNAAARGKWGEKVPPPIKKGNITVYRPDTGEVLYSERNIITSISSWLFAQFMACASPLNLSPPQTQPVSIAATEPAWGVWGLALGAGSPTWAPTTQPVETATQVELIQPLARVQLSRVNFVTQDSSGNWNPQAVLTTNVEFQTTVNSTTNNINQGIREMGLIGGGIANMGSYTMLTAPYFNGNPSSYATVQASQQTVILLNYKTLPPLLLPPGIDIIFSWIFQF